MEILYQDKALAVIVKPVGMESQAEIPAALTKALGGAFYPVHRLDLNVGGVMVYARSKEAAAALSRTIQDGAMVKEYVALVHGVPPESGDWEDLIFSNAMRTFRTTFKEKIELLSTAYNLKFAKNIPD